MRKQFVEVIQKWLTLNAKALFLDFNSLHLPAFLRVFMRRIVCMFERYESVLYEKGILHSLKLCICCHCINCTFWSYLFDTQIFSSYFIYLSVGRGFRISEGHSSWLHKVLCCKEKLLYTTASFVYKCDIEPFFILVMFVLDCQDVKLCLCNSDCFQSCFMTGSCISTRIS